METKSEGPLKGDALYAAVQEKFPAFRFFRDEESRRVRFRNIPMLRMPNGHLRLVQLVSLVGDGASLPAGAILLSDPSDIRAARANARANGGKKRRMVPSVRIAMMCSAERPDAYAL